MGPLAYPWGFPLALAPFYALFGLNLLALKWVNLVFYLLFLMTLWYGLRNRHTFLWRTILVCFFAFNPYMMGFLNNLLSDIPFLFLSTLMVLMIGRVTIQRMPIISTKWDHLLLGIGIALATFVRVNAVLLLGTLALTQFIEALRAARDSVR
jgi:hypothetical protein